MHQARPVGSVQRGEPGSDRPGRRDSAVPARPALHGRRAPAHQAASIEGGAAMTAYSCPGLVVQSSDEYRPCYRAGHGCPRFVAQVTETVTHLVTAWRCPCCGSRGFVSARPWAWVELDDARMARAAQRYAELDRPALRARRRNVEAAMRWRMQRRRRRITRQH